MIPFLLAPVYWLALWSPPLSQAALANDAYAVRLEPDGAIELQRGDLPARRFEPSFLVLHSAVDPRAEMRWGDLGDQRILYNVKCWRLSPDAVAATPGPPAKPDAHVADGFDSRTDLHGGSGRTFDAYRAAPGVTLRATGAALAGNRIAWTFPDQERFSLSAWLSVPDGASEPLLEFSFEPKASGWFSVAYTGAPSCDPGEAEDIWQPMVWQEKRFPLQPCLTEAGRCTLPAALVTQDDVTAGIVADPSELPFMPMPTVANSRFGVALRNAEGLAQPALFAPTLGGAGSEMKPGDRFSFQMRLFLGRGRTPAAYEQIARGLFQFRDYRRNGDLGSLNRTLERMTGFALSDWARFHEDLRGCCYDTDVPGSVKNVSALHPLSVALVTDDASIFERRARPMIEYLLSREKFLFTTNPETKGQGASSKLAGPCAPLSELAALYSISGNRSPVLLKAAEDLFGRNRVLNLDEEMEGSRWQNAFALWRATGQDSWRERTMAGADAYLRERFGEAQTAYPKRGAFFWTSFAPDWMELCALAEATGEARYWEAAREGARRFAQFVWMCPVVPGGEVLVNEGGRAPAYRQGDRFPPIFLPEEKVPAWRVSELGLTPESSGTCKGHRGVFLATHAPFMLRIAQETGDEFLHDIGRSAVVGRYTSFPGYHMNTARTTVYEKPDFAERPLAQINSTSSLHYNHIWPQVALLLDYLVADAAFRSRGAISFPWHFAEGYGYLQGRIYGDRPGQFFGDGDVWLWMPRELLSFDSSEVNYVAGRAGDRLYLALMNESPEPVSATFRLDSQLVRGGVCQTRVWREGQTAGRVSLELSKFQVEIAPRGLTALAIEGVQIEPKFQGGLSGGSAWRRDYAEQACGGTRAMVLNFGPGMQSAYVYLQASAAQCRQATLHHATDGAWESVTDQAFPFEFTVPLAPSAERFEFRLELVTPSGERQESGLGQLAR